jgi:hypothetical protein
MHFMIPFAKSMPPEQIDFPKFVSIAATIYNILETTANNLGNFF